MGCKGFRLDDNIMIAREIRLKHEADRPYKEVLEERNAIKKERLNSVHCALCRLPYKSFEVNYVLPFKLLMMFKNHTYVSGRHDTLNLAHLKVTAPEFLSHGARLCEICYMLIIEEYKLVEQEKMLGTLMNIPVKDIDVIQALDYSQPNFMPDELTQWRLLIHISRLDRAKDLVLKKQNKYKIHFEIFGSKFEYVVPV